VEERQFRVCSVVAGFKDAAAAVEYDKNFPLKFYGAEAEPKRAEGSSEFERWQTRIAPELGRLDGVLLCSAVRDADADTGGSSTSILDANGLDNINWDLLALQWESLLLDVLPAIVPNELDLKIHLFGATRFRPVLLHAQDLEEAVSEAQEFIDSLFQRWGLDVSGDAFIRDGAEQVATMGGGSTLKAVATPDRVFCPPFSLLWRSLKPESFWKLVAEICFGRRDSSHYSRISQAVDSALGFSLIYDHGKIGKRSNKLPKSGRHLHYVADVASTLVVPKSSSVKSNFEPFHPAHARGVVGHRERIVWMLNANRLLDAGDCDSEAIACFSMLTFDAPGDLAYFALAERLGQRLPSLAGDDLLRLTESLSSPPAWLSKNRISVAERVGRHTSSDSDAVAGQVESRPRGEVKACDQMPRQLDRSRFQSLSDEWLLLRYQNKAEYNTANENWHKRVGFYVRVSASGKITVFADLSKVKKESLPLGFRTPEKTSFKPDGSLLGDEWVPNDEDLEGGVRAVKCDRSSEIPQPSDRAWVGPVPTGMNSSQLSRQAEVVLPGWIPEDKWEGGVEQGWWMPIRRLGEQACKVPESITLLGHVFDIRKASPSTFKNQ
jgi:hypothetical protein